MKEHILIRLSVFTQPGQQPFSEDDCHHLIDFAARVITPISIGTIPNEIGQRHHLTWETGTLRSLIAEHFHKSPVDPLETMRLPKSFDAWSLCKIGGMKIRFTDSLSDHLLLIDDDDVVLIFHHASYLKQQSEQ